MAQHAIKVRKTYKYRSQWGTPPDGPDSPKMWVGECTCGDWTQYWAFGATLGSMLEHQRRGTASG